MKTIVDLLCAEVEKAPATVLLAILAIIFAVIQFCDSLVLKGKMRNVIDKEDELVKKTEAVTGRIEDVERSLSSRFVGAFPKDLKAINDVMNGADRFVLIISDWITYGEYSAPELYEEYKRRLKDIHVNKDEPVKIMILTYNEAGLKEQFASQFPKTSFEQEKTRDRYKKYFQRYHPGIQEPKQYDEFASTVLKIELEERRSFISWGAEIQEVQDLPSLLLWMEDGEDAVFCLQTSGGNERVLSFRTRDIVLISSLYDMFRTHWKGVIPALPHQQSNL
jgi:hypothetical protein